ncbi:MAG TPA: hypothetical protein PKX38_06465 [Alphaproteobacteria bacterium]|jgi:hypothetical protein|nr:hypothetical protein [Micavibrio sp.]MBK9562721.1 hypothetical protein [Micavibrio sp.]HQX27563.1 hypothetical protein [Alphaproteobacteria bacterium]
MNIETVPAKGKPKNVLKGAIQVAIKNAERYRTSLIVKGRDGRIQSLNPSQMKRRLKSKS